MAKKAKNFKSAKLVTKSDKKIQRYLIAFPVLAFAIKMIIMFNIQAGGWLGADGENYLAAVDGLRTDGLFSAERNLHYWPAGYSIFIWPLTQISLSNFLYLLSVIQGLIFAGSTYFFTTVISKTNLKYLAIPASFIISFNPTLSLGSNVVGYETPSAALILLAIGFLIKDKIEKSSVFSLKLASFSAITFSLACFFQPRILIFALAIIIIYALNVPGTKFKIKFISISTAILMIFPFFLIVRNVEAIGSATISTNLGTTMFIGIGDGATGGYNGKYNGVPCPAAAHGTEAQIDSAKVKCALTWQIMHPNKSAVLAAKKALFYWSPWFGPEANGTMARNPWLKIHPIKNSIKSQQNYELVFGSWGKFASLLWVFMQLLFLFVGITWIWKLGSLEKVIAQLAAAPVLLGWLISMATIGDHRFRIPQMGLSLFLQTAGAIYLRRKISKAL